MFILSVVAHDRVMPLTVNEQEQAVSDPALALDQEGHGLQPGHPSSSPPRPSTTVAAAAAAVASVGEAGDGQGQGQQQQVVPPPESLEAEAAVTRAESAAAAKATNDGEAAGVQGLSAAGSDAASSGSIHASAGASASMTGSAAPDAEGQQTQEVSSADAGTSSTARDRERQIHKAFLDMLGERSYQEKRDTLDYLANPAARPDNPRLPVLSAAQKQLVLNADRSAKSWPKDVVMNADYDGLSSDLADERIKEKKDWRPAASSEWVGLVPTMKRRIQDQDENQQLGVSGGSSRKAAAGGEGSALDIFPYQADSAAARAGAREGPNTKRPRLDGYDGDELTPMLRRLDEQEAAFARHTAHLPDASPAAARYPGASSALTRTSAGTLSRTPKPGRVGGLGAGALRDRRRSSGSVLRYRSKSFTPRARPSLGGDMRFGAGTLGDWLGQSQGQGQGQQQTANDGRSRNAFSRASLGQGGQGGGGSPKPRAESSAGAQGESSGAGAGTPGAAAAGNKRAAFSPGHLDGSYAGMNATPRKKMLQEAIAEEGEMLVKRVQAEAKATAEVGGILMSVVAQENKTRDVARQVREEQALRATSQKTPRQQEQGGGGKVWEGATPFVSFVVIRLQMP